MTVVTPLVSGESKNIISDVCIRAAAKAGKALPDVMISTSASPDSLRCCGGGGAHAFLQAAERTDPGGVAEG